MSLVGWILVVILGIIFYNYVRYRQALDVAEAFPEESQEKTPYIPLRDRALMRYALDQCKNDSWEDEYIKMLNRHKGLDN